MPTATNDITKISFRSLGCYARHVAHLAAVAYRRFAVEVDERARHREPLRIVRDLGADQIDHLDPSAAHGLAERPAGDRADMLLELRHGGAVDGPVAGIVH